MRLILAIICLLTSFMSLAQVPEVPHKLMFADMELVLTKGAREDIQKEVNRLHKSSAYFQRYVRLADLYFPLIDRVFQEENFPEDIKYLIIQESGFVPDAVSSSKAVGYWQFKEGTAQEMGLRVDRLIDERKNIERASRGAAGYMSKTNKKLNNWVYSLLSYNRGPGGVMEYVDSKDIGNKKMTIDRHMHWYVIKFLGHMVAFQDYVGKTPAPEKLVVDLGFSGLSLKDAAKKYNVEITTLIAYNAWISPSRKIPDDKSYAVIVPVEIGYSETVRIEKDSPEMVAQKIENKVAPVLVDVPIEYEHAQSKSNVKMKINGVPGMTAIKGDNSSRLAIKGGLTKSRFLRYNDLKSFEDLVPGQVYFLKPKKRQGASEFYTVQPGESLWFVSQKLGVRKDALRIKNGMSISETLLPGRVLWLKQTRPANVEVEYKKVRVVTKKVPVTVEKKEQPKEEVIQQRPVEEEKKVETAKEVRQPMASVFDGTFHTVQPGQTLYAIAKEYHISSSLLMDWNDLTNEGLSPGQKLRVVIPRVKKTPVQQEEKVNKEIIVIDEAPEVEVFDPVIEKVDTVEVEKPKNPVITHVVAQGETLYAISRNYQVTPAEIITWNDLPSNAINIGQVLKIHLPK